MATLFLLTLPSVLPCARSFCPLPLLYPSASDFKFPSAGDRWFMACYWTSDRIAGNGGAEGVKFFFTFLPFYSFTFRTAGRC